MARDVRIVAVSPRNWCCRSGFDGALIEGGWLGGKVGFNVDDEVMNFVKLQISLT